MTPFEIPSLTFLSLDEWIQKNKASPFNVDELAERFNTNRMRIYRLIKAETGLSPSRYIRKKRIENAKILLSTSFMDIKEVSMHCGFNQAAYFTKCFKDEVGITPSAFIAQTKTVS